MNPANLEPLPREQWTAMVSEDRKNVFISRFSHEGYRWWEKIPIDEIPAIQHGWSQFKSGMMRYIRQSKDQDK